LGDKVPLPTGDPNFAFTIPKDGSLPFGGLAPSIIDHRGDSSYVASIPDLGARLHSLTLECPDPSSIEALYRELAIGHPPVIVQAPKVRYRALIETPNGLRELTCPGRNGSSVRATRQPPACDRDEGAAAAPWRSAAASGNVAG